MCNAVLLPYSQKTVIHTVNADVSRLDITWMLCFLPQSCHEMIDQLFKNKIHLVGFTALVVAVIMVRRWNVTHLSVTFTYRAWHLSLRQQNTFYFIHVCHILICVAGLICISMGSQYWILYVICWCCSVGLFLPHVDTYCTSAARKWH